MTDGISYEVTEYWNQTRRIPGFESQLAGPLIFSFFELFTAHCPMMSSAVCAVLCEPTTIDLDVPQKLNK